LRRAKQPSCIPPPELEALPALVYPFVWINPLDGYEYDRNDWHANAGLPGGALTLAAVQRVEGGFVTTMLGGSAGAGAGARRTPMDAAQAFTLAANWVRQHEQGG
jgi:hypothetical protein